MDDTQLTEKAIDELMREMDASKQVPNGPQERKKNPLGRPTFHRRFLTRTVSSAMQFNKRKIERTQKSSLEMLHEMDNRDRMRAKNAFFNGRGSRNDEPNREYKAKKRKSRSRSRNKHSSRSRNSSANNSNNSRSGDRTHHKKQRRKHKKHLSKKNKRGKRSSSSISSSSTTQDSSRSRSSSTNRNKCNGNLETVENNSVNSTLPLDLSYMQTNTFTLTAIALAYGHMQGIINSTNTHEATTTPKDLLQDDKLSDTSITKELALTDNDDSDANDEQGDDSGMLTFDVSTSDEDEKVITDENKHLIRTITKAAVCDSDSSASCISLDSVNDQDIGNSNAMPTTTVKSMETIDDVQVLSSSDSEDDTVEIISVHQVKNEQVTVDLTDD